MHIIAITCLTSKGIIALTCACTQKEFEHYMETGEVINEYTISGTFLKKYLGKQGLNLTSTEPFITTISEISKGTGNIYTWHESRVLSILEVKDILNKCQLSYNDFIDSYAEHLKSL